MKNNNNDRLFSVPPQHYQQAQEILQQRIGTFKNWQDVIRLAISYGLPRIGQTDYKEQVRECVQKSVQAHKKTVDGNKLDNIAKKAFANRLCQYGGPPGCKVIPCGNCRNLVVKQNPEWIKNFGKI